MMWIVVVQVGCRAASAIAAPMSAKLHALSLAVPDQDLPGRREKLQGSAAASAA
jgi:hypothetical protein